MFSHYIKSGKCSSKYSFTSSQQIRLLEPLPFNAVFQLLSFFASLSSGNTT